MWSVKLDVNNKYIRNYEVGNSIFTDASFTFRIIEHTCEQCGLPILDEKIREDFHGCCSSECEKEKINNKESIIVIEDRVFANREEAKKYFTSVLVELEQEYKIRKAYLKVYNIIISPTEEQLQHTALEKWYKDSLDEISKILESLN